MSALLEVRDLKINFNTYEGTAQVINGVNIEVKKGEVIALVGESGCGKSVTVRSMLGLVPTPPARYVNGDIRFEGKSLLNLSEDAWQQVRGRGISMIFQDPMTSLNPVFTIGQQLMDVYMYQGRKNLWLGSKKELRAKARARAIEILEKMRIPDPEAMLDRYPVELSGGMRQRILIALALIHNPKLLIADEPGTALDVSVQDQILIELKRLVEMEGISMIFITHNLGVARMISDRTYVMYAGEVVEEAKTDLLFSEQYHPYTQGLLSSIPKLSGRMGDGIDGKIPDFTNPPQGCRYYDRCPKRLTECKTVPPHLQPIEDGRKVACHLFNEKG
ncbi:ABC transporter ATP-binding protein [Brevibacillus humidisoli]|uniref:ABC transporter ATP-binding protein n=1 Tax=Brevibacillus humidisoli TaxID=2895522 RepID=UPI001E597664|nr:ABC transporter ATP-binding protein [Brevibacillus humidisoli]UFJ39264.1 ABC transporter ATP-binding protein [Brevibacillus humidisoli]